MAPILGLLKRERTNLHEMKLPDFIKITIPESGISSDALYRNVESATPSSTIITMDRVQDILQGLEDAGEIHLAKGLWFLGSRKSENGLNSVEGKKEDIILSVEARQRWKDFRRLLSYYSECIRFDEKASHKLFSDQINKQWLPISMYRDWYSEERSEYLSIPLSNEHSKFNLNIVSQRSEQLFIGYPLEIVKTPKYQFVVPIYCIPVSAEGKSVGQNLELSLDFDSTDANSDWLEYSCPNREAREHFLNASGLRDPGGRDLDDEIEDEQTITDKSDILSFDIDRLLNALKTFHGDNLNGRNLNPLEIAPMLPIESIDKGIHNSMVLFSGKKLRFTASLVRELRRLQNHAKDEEFEKSALKHIFFPSEDSTDTEKKANVFPVLDLTQSQFKAACKSSTENLSVVTGPPGTGKSQVVSVALASSLLRGETAVFASKNHRALDAVTPRLNSLSDTLPVIRRQKQMEVSEHSWKKVIDEILANPSGDQNTLEEFTSRKAYCMRKSEDLVEIVEEYQTIIDGRQENSSRYWKRKEILSRREYAKIDFDLLLKRNNGKSLDKFSRKMEALYKYFREESPKWKFWGGFTKRKKSTKAQTLVKDIFKATGLPKDFFSTDDQKFARNSEKALTLSKDLSVLHSLESDKSLTENTEDLSELRKQCKEIIEELKTHAIDTLRMSLSMSMTSFDETERQKLATAKIIIKQLEEASSDQELARLSWQLSETFKTLLSKTPLLAVTNLSAMRMLPSTEPAQFDLLVVDEASQCDIPSTIPLLFRAKRACVIGDPKQLKAIHPMKQSMHSHIKKKGKLESARFAPYDYLEFSFFDLASQFSGKAKTRLVEHFRCHSHIAGYCNSVSYNNELYILTDESNLKGNYKGRVGLHWTHIAGSCKRENSGGSKCHEEADAVVKIVKEVAEDSSNRFSLGVVTPFRSQANLIKQKLEKILKAKDWNELDLIVETADGFQGDERDVIIFSVACQPDMHRGSLWFVSQEQNRWNVAVSRAKALLHIVGNRDFCLNSNINHVRRLAEHAVQERTADRDPFDSPWEKKLFDALKKTSIETVPQHPLAGYRLDLAIPDKKIDIEVDGKKYHLDEFGKRKSSDIWRDMTVENLGWTVLRFWVHELNEDMDACVDQIRTLCQSYRDGER